MQPQHINCYGRVIGKRNLQPVVKAKVSLTIYNQLPIVRYTDSEGYYQFPVNFDGHNILSARIRVEAEQYEPYERLIELLPHQGIEEIRFPEANPSVRGRMPIPIMAAVIAAVATIIAAFIAAQPPGRQPSISPPQITRPSNTR